MNILHLKYALEIEKHHSINKAAETLYMSQPNLSRALKELEEDLGISIFKRTSKGMTTTVQGEEFLSYAKKILAQIDEVENMYKNGGCQKQKFSISVPRSSYISYAFSQFAKKAPKEKPIEFFYKETNSKRAIDNILQEDYKLGIIRYKTSYDSYFKTMLREKGLAFEELAEFSYMLVMSEEHPLADKDNIRLSDLKEYTEISHADPYVPSMPLAELKREELGEYVDNRIFVFERASQFDLLQNVPDTFMWITPMSEEKLTQFGLIEKSSEDNNKIYRDVLIYRKNYKLTKLDLDFIEEVKTAMKKFGVPSI